MLNLDKEEYTKDEVMELFKPFEQQITDFTAITQEKDEALEKIKELEKGNLTNAIKLEMTKAGLDPESMFDLVDSDSIEKSQSKITKLVEMKRQNKLNNSFKPEEHRQTDEYADAEKNGDVQNMIKSKISKLFQNQL